MIGAGRHRLLPSWTLDVGEDLPTDICHPCAGDHRWPEANFLQDQGQERSLDALARKRLQEHSDACGLQPVISEAHYIAGRAQLNQSHLWPLPSGDLGRRVQGNRIPYRRRLLLGQTVRCHELPRCVGASDLEPDIRIEPFGQPQVMKQRPHVQQLTVKADGLRGAEHCGEIISATTVVSKCARRYFLEKEFGLLTEL